MKGKGTDFKTLMWAYHDERMARKRKFLNNNRVRNIDFIIRLYRPHRSESVLGRLLSIEAESFARKVKRGGNNEMD